MAFASVCLLYRSVPPLHATSFFGRQNFGA